MNPVTRWQRLFGIDLFPQGRKNNADHVLKKFQQAASDVQSLSVQGIQEWFDAANFLLQALLLDVQRLTTQRLHHTTMLRVAEPWKNNPSGKFLSRSMSQAVLTQFKTYDAAIYTLFSDEFPPHHHKACFVKQSGHLTVFSVPWECGSLTIKVSKWHYDGGASDKLQPARWTNSHKLFFEWYPIIKQGMIEELLYHPKPHCCVDLTGDLKNQVFPFVVVNAPLAGMDLVLKQPLTLRDIRGPVNCCFFPGSWGKITSVLSRIFHRSWAI